MDQSEGSIEADAMTWPPEAFWLSVAMCTLAGALTVMYYVSYRQVASTPSSAPADSAAVGASDNRSDKDPTKYELFVTSTVHQAPVVLFTTGEDTRVLELCRLNNVSIHHVNLDRVAGKAAIILELQQWCKFTSPWQEVLFVDGEFVGDSATVLSMAQSGTLAALFDMESAAFVLPNAAGHDVLLAVDASSLRRQDAPTRDQVLLPDSVQSLMAWDVDLLESPSQVPLAKRPRATNRQRSHLTVFSSPDAARTPAESATLETASASLAPWEIVDTVVFTSQSLLALPPRGFTDAAHRNGVRVLGSITWEVDHAATAASCDWETLASQLQRVQTRAGIDGWHLVNLSETAIAELTQHFTSLFVLWSPSPAQASVVSDHTIASLLSSVVDGVVLPSPADKATLAKRAKAAGDCRWQLYFGLDARQSEMSARVLRFADVSVCASLEAVTENEFWKTNWRSLAPVENVYGGGPEAYYTAFNVGCGAATYVEGREVSSLAWSDASQMDVLPTLNKVKSPIKMEISLARAFHGGSSLHLSATLPSKSRASVELVALQVHFAPRKVIRVAYTFYTAAADPTAFGLALNLTSKHELVLRGGSATSSPPPSTSASLSPMLGRAKNTRAYGPVSETTVNGWRTRVYHLGGALWDGHVIKSLSVFGVNLSDAGESNHWSVYLGQVVVCPLADLPLQPPDVASVEFDPTTASLAWTVPSTVQYTHVFEETTSGDEIDTVWRGRVAERRWSLPPFSDNWTYVLQAVAWTGELGPRRRVTVAVHDKRSQQEQ